MGEGNISNVVKSQNWFAVLINLFIVILGVFLGVQMGNLNEKRQDEKDYRAALERLTVEAQTNIDMLQTLDKESSRLLKKGSKAFDALLSCADDPDSTEVVNSGLMAISGTYGIKLHRSVLDEVTTSEKLLAAQSTAMRQRLSEMKYYFNLALYEAQFVETIPLEERMQNNEIIGVGNSSQGNVTYAGADFSRRQRRLVLKVPVSKACENDALIKSFYTWERWQSVLPTLSNILRKEIEKTLVILQEKS